MRWTGSGWDSSGLCRFEAEILQSGAAGLQPPQIDGEQPGASHHGFLSGGSAGGGVATKNMWKFPKAPPGRVPFLEPPDRFHQQSAHARLPSRSILPSFCLVPVLHSLGQQPM